MKNKDRYDSLSHEKFSLRYHLIFSTKYRRKCLGPVAGDIKNSMRRAEAMQNKWKIEYMEIDPVMRDHIHFLIKATPSCVLADIAHKLKQVSTYDIWQTKHEWISRFYRSGQHHLWTRGYFISTVGDVSEKNLKDYIERQG